jgi:hypothetical protein
MDPWEHQLEQDLNWREAELASLKILVAEAPSGSVRQQALLRALWAMLYAHYEGFCKFAWDTYLDHLQASAPIRGDCVENVARFSLSASFRVLRGDLSLPNLWAYCTTGFQGLMSQPVVFDDRLETDSNLWPDLCRENSAAVGLPHAAVDQHRARIKALVSRRNEIAHGQRMVIRSLDEYQEYETAAMEVMYELALGIVNCLSNRTYLQPAAP